MNRSHKRFWEGIAILLALFAVNCGAFAQTRTILITVEDPRPMAAAILQLEELSGIPINYEDMPVYYAADMKPTGVAAGQTPPPGVRLTIVPRGGQLSVPIVVDATTGRLKDIQAVNTALTALVSAYNTSNLPGGFEFEYLNGVFFVKPVRYRDASGATLPMTPVLSVPITFPEETRDTLTTWRLILDEVSKAAGVQIGLNLGMGALGGKTTIGAQNEPAYRVIARMLASGNSPAAASVNASWDASLSYLFFCQPQYGCVLNVVRARPIDLCRGSGCEPYSPPPRKSGFKAPPSP